MRATCRRWDRAMRSARRSPCARTLCDSTLERANLNHSVFIIVVASYLLGSIPFGYLLVRIFRGQDVRRTGSGNIGATNVARTGSKGLAIATLFLDALKGYAAVKFAFWIASRQRLEGPVPATLYDRSAGGLSS